MSVFMAYLKDRVKYLTPIRTREEYLAHRDSAAQRMIMGKVRKGNEKMKGSLVQMVYSCLPNEDGTLKKSKHMSSTIAMDVDHIPAEEMEPTKQRILEKKDELGLLMLEVSARGEGYHLVFRRRPELSQEDNLKWANELLGVKFDSGAQDITRVFYTTTNKELLFLDDRIFEVQEVQDVQGVQEVNNDNVNEKLNSQLSTDSKLSILNSQLEYKGVSFQKIIDAWSKQRFSEDGASRHDASVRLARDLYIMTDRDKAKTLSLLLAQPWVQEIIEERNENVERTVNDAAEYVAAQESENAKKGKAWLPKISKEMSEALGNESTNDERRKTNDEKQSDTSSDDSSAVPPAMPEKLPKLITLLTSKTPDKYKGAVSHTVFPPLATHLCGVRFRYTDNVEHEATLMNCLMAGTGAGKGCIDEPIRHIMADIKRRDAENERREAEWKKDCQKKGANKDRMVRPEGLVIQMIDPDMTKPALVTRMDEAEGHFVYVKLNELDLFEQLKGQTGKQHFQLMCLAFDPGAEYGQTRVGTQSVTARPVCRFNWNACTTVLKGRRFFSKVLTDGPISRINFCTIPEEEIGAEQPVYGQYDAEFDEALKPYIDNLVAARGLIDCPQAFKLAKQLQEECAEFARLSQNEVYWNLSHRACVIAWLKACVLYVANGQKWEKTIEDFVRWSLNYDLWCKMQFFAEDIEKATNGDGARIGSRGPRNLLELLPDVFTLDDAKRVRQQQGMTTNNTSKMVSQWKSRGYILQLTVDSFQKNGIKN